MKEAEEKSEQHPLSPKRTPSQAYRSGESDAVNRVLAEVEYQGQKRVRSGYNEFNFTGGVLNCFLMIFIFVFDEEPSLFYICPYISPIASGK